MLLAFLNPHLECTGRLVDYAVRKEMDCIGFICTTGSVYEVNLGGPRMFDKKDASAVFCVTNESTATQVCALYERLQVPSFDYAIIDDIEDGYLHIDALFLQENAKKN